MISIGLTGGMGSGKTTISQIFQHLDVPVFNSDEMAKKSYFESDIKDQVIGLLGNEAYDKEQLNRALISDRIFNDAELRSQLENIIHPWVKKQWELFREEHFNCAYTIQESAIFKLPLDKTLHHGYIGVIADRYLRIQRLRKRSSLSESEIQLRMDLQVSDDELSKQCDWIIHNENQHAVLPQVMSIHHAILERIPNVK